MRVFNFPKFLIYNLSIISEHTLITFKTPNTQGSSLPMTLPRVIPIFQTTLIAFNVRSNFSTDPSTPWTLLILNVCRVWLCYHSVVVWSWYDKGTLFWKWHLLYEWSFTITSTMDFEIYIRWFLRLTIIWAPIFFENIKLIIWAPIKFENIRFLRLIIKWALIDSLSLLRLMVTSCWLIWIQLLVHNVHLPQRFLLIIFGNSTYWYRKMFLNGCFCIYCKRLLTWHWASFLLLTWFSSF